MLAQFDEAFSYLDDNLKSALTKEDIQSFFGSFSSVRPPLTDTSGRDMGLIASEGSFSSARLIEFGFSDARISDISEV